MNKNDFTVFNKILLNLKNNNITLRKSLLVVRPIFVCALQTQRWLEACLLLRCSFDQTLSPWWVEGTSPDLMRRLASIYFVYESMEVNLIFFLLLIGKIEYFL